MFTDHTYQSKKLKLSNHSQEQDKVEETISDTCPDQRPQTPVPPALETPEPAVSTEADSASREVDSTPREGSCAAAPIIVSEDADDEIEDDGKGVDDEDADPDAGFRDSGGEANDASTIDLTASGDIVFGSEFEKLDVYEKFLDDPNPWHPDLRRELFPSQVIGYHWMLDRHNLGGGLVADKVGCGKVYQI